MVNIYQVTDNRWSNALTTYNAIWMDVNNGAGGAAVGASASRLLKLTNNTTERFGVDLTGKIINVATGTQIYSGTNGLGTTVIFDVNSTGLDFYYSGSIGAKIGAGYLDIAGSNDTRLYRDAANTLAMRNGGSVGSPVPQTFNVYNFYAGAADYERGIVSWIGSVFYVGTQAAGTGVGRPMHLYAAGVMNFSSNGITSWQLSAGNWLAQADNTYDIGAAGANRPRNLHIGTQILAGATAPAYSFASETTTGMYLVSARLLGLEVNATPIIGLSDDGGNVLRLNSGQMEFTTNVGNAGDTILRRYYSSTTFGAALQHGGADTNAVTTALTSISNASPAVITTAATNTYNSGTPIKFTTTGALPTGLTVGTQYYILTILSSTTFTVSASVGGAAINTSGAGSGTHSMVVGPISQYIRMQGAITGTDLVGAPCYILGSAGTGAGAGGSIIFQVAPASGSSGTQNSYATALTIDSTKLATFGGNILMPPTNSKISFVSGSYGFEYYANDLGFLNTNGSDWAIRFQTFRNPVFLSNAIVGFCSSSVTAYGNTADTAITRDSAGVLSNRNSTNAQNFRVYTTYTDASNGAWAFINAAQTGGTEGGAANTLTFGSIGNGTGAANLTKFKLLVDGTNRADYNITSLSNWAFGGALTFTANTVNSFNGLGQVSSAPSLQNIATNGVVMISADTILLESQTTAQTKLTLKGATSYLGFTNDNSYATPTATIGTVDAAIQRVQQGVLRVSATTSGTTFGGIQFVGGTYASLPTAASAGAGARFYITDGTTSTFYATVSGTGANAVCVFSDGTQYRVG